MKNFLLLLISFLCALSTQVFAQGSGHALNFSGSAVVRVASNSTVNFGSTRDFSIEFWMRANPAQPNGFTQLVGKNRGYGTRGYNVVTENSTGRLRLLIDWGGSRVVSTFSGSPNLLDDKYHHIAVTFDRDANAEAFVDGVSIGTINISASNGQNIDNGNDIWMGNFELWPNQFVGTLDEVRIWNKALTQAEVRTNMCKKLTGSEAGLVAYYRMDEGADNTCSGGEDVCDLTGNNNHGVKF